jgi:hypothetical protein
MNNEEEKSLKKDHVKNSKQFEKNRSIIRGHLNIEILYNLRKLTVW